MRKVKRTRLLLIGAAAVAIAALVVSPAIGGPSIKKLVRKEVRKQIANATGPQGPQGPQGIQGSRGPRGATGAAGSAKAIVHVGVADGGPTIVDAANTTAGTEVCRAQTGGYSVDVPVNVRNVIVTPDASGSNDPSEPRMVRTFLGGLGVCAGFDFSMQFDLKDGTDKDTGFFAVVN